LEARLDLAKFICLSRGALATIDYIARVTPMDETQLLTEQLRVARVTMN
jgi:hypothetical protein